MDSRSNDQEILAVLTEKLGDLSERITYDDRNYLIMMNLSELNLSHLPLEIGQLSNLQVLDLAGNQLSQLPSEIVQLSSLQVLDLAGNQLSQLPPEIGQLSNLQELYLAGNQLSQLPPEIVQLSNLRVLDLGENQLSQLPPEIVQLSSLQELSLFRNQLSQLPPEIVQLTSLQKLDLAGNQLSQLPPEIVQLTSLQELYLAGNQLSQLPSEIVQLSSLQVLYLGENQLSQLPPEIGQLSNLQELELGENQLSQLPPEIGQLSNLQIYFVLRGNQLSQLPPEIGQLTSLQVLYLGKNQLSQLPPEIGQLSNLQELSLFRNQLSQLPPEIVQLSNLQELDLAGNQLSQLPSEIVQLTSLQELDLAGNQLSQLPSEIVQLSNLRTLDLGGNQLSQLPPEIGQLSNLQTLSLFGNQLSQLPPEIGQLSNLQELDLAGNQLSQLPPEIVQLTSLQKLDLAGNQLSQLPPEIVQLSNLRTLDLGENQLNQLPPEIGQLSNLQTLIVEYNSELLTPPPEVVTGGTQAILDFFQELLKDSVIRFEAKLLLVGEGGTGKSSLLKSLRNEVFDQQLPSTHGIEVNHLTLQHPIRTDTKIILNTWDFGGQHIYHATHQFFLTKRSLYMVVWNARLGVEQGRLHFWLQTIQALAPDAPVLLVATHIDERTPDINFQSYKEEYPQLVGSYSVSNKNKSGIHELKEVLAHQAARLRLMGQPWPRRWLEVEQHLVSLPEHHIDARTYREYCVSNKVDADIAMGTLGNYLHDLGKILYFRDDPILSNLVVLKPNWVTKAISCVLTDEETRAANGILSHAALPRIWGKDDKGQNYEPHLYPVFLRLMERFDLSYQIDSERPGRPSTQSLVPQLLPYQPPVNVPPWPTTPNASQTYVEMRYRFDFVPAGIIPWFIVRTHSYTQHMHWQEGVSLKYQGHQARVELKKRELRLVVWGIQPHNFFTILMNTLDLILARFEGLQVQREVPCTCHWQRDDTDPCPRFYRYEDLARRMEAGKQEVECPDSFQSVSVPQLLYGIHTSTTEQVIADIRRDQQVLLQEQRMIQRDLTSLPEMRQLLIEVNQRSELIWRELIRQWNVEMQREELECPNVFILTLGKSKRFNPKNWVSQEYQLYLICQHPEGPHQVGNGYSLREAKDWWTTMSPWLNRLSILLKVGIPLTKAVGDVLDKIDVDQMKNQIALMEEITKGLPMLPMLDTLDSAVPETHFQHEQQVIGPALRALHSFLIQADSSKIWGGLDKTQTPDGNILWLCEHHRQPYAVKPLSQQYIK